MILKKLTIIASLMLTPFSSDALTGNELYELMESKKVDDNYRALTYIQATADAITFHKGVIDPENKLGLNVCIPANATFRQILDVVHKALKDDPANRNIRAYMIAYYALATTWPCEK